MNTTPNPPSHLNTIQSGRPLTSHPASLYSAWLQNERRKQLGIRIEKEQDMIEPRDYWENCFEGMNPESHDFSKSKPASLVVDFCDNHLKDEAVVLDLGCGGGRNAHYLAERGYKVYGVDIAATAVEFCRKRFARFSLPGTFRQGTFDRIPFPDGVFSGVICIAAFDHVTLKTAQASIVEVRHVLAPGGVILMTFDPPEKDEDILDEAEMLPDGTLKFVRGEQAGMLFRRYPDGEIKSLLGEPHIISFDHAGNGTRVVVCR